MILYLEIPFNTINEVLNSLKDKQATAAFKSQAFQLFRDVTFGDDLADVVDIDKTKIKEMTVDYINELETKVTNFIHQA